MFSFYHYSEHGSSYTWTYEHLKSSNHWLRSTWNWISSKHISKIKYRLPTGGRISNAFCNLVFNSDEIVPMLSCSKFLLVQSQQWKHQSNLWNLFKVDYKDTRLTLKHWWLVKNLLRIRLQLLSISFIWTSF